MTTSEACKGGRQEKLFDKKEPNKLIIGGRVVT